MDDTTLHNSLRVTPPNDVVELLGDTNNDNGVTVLQNGSTNNNGSINTKPGLTAKPMSSFKKHNRKRLEVDVKKVDKSACCTRLCLSIKSIFKF